MIVFMNQELTKRKEEILLYDPHKTLFTWIVFSFPFLCFFPIYVFLLFFFKFQFHPVILYLFGIELHIFFQFTFYEVISVSWPGPRVWLGLLKFFFLFLICFLNFILQYWVDSELGFLICFGLNSMTLSSFHDSGHEFRGLTWIDLSYFLYLFLI